MRTLLPLLTAIFFLAPAAARAHQQPTTLMMLDTQPGGRVDMTLHVPLSELELAFGHGVNRQPPPALATWGKDFERYLAAHIHPQSEGGAAWAVEVRELRLGEAEQTQSGPFQEVLARLRLTPPAGANPRRFVLRYDLILHQVVTHKAMVSLQSDWEGGQVEPAAVGVIAMDTGTGRVEPLPIDLGQGHWWNGFTAMAALGAEHIRAGADHLLFLLVLLLPATLTVSGGRWGPYGGSRYSAIRLVKIVSAFTLGHSATLLAGALHWLTLPQQPVEILIATSILVSAVHAIRPVFPGWEARVAAGFGLVHGLAFATVLAEMKLTAGPMMLSILGFNLGIEFAQLLAVALTMPWLLLLSLTPAHAWVRTGGAAMAAVAAAGWMINRVTGAANAVEQAMTQLTELAPLGILALAGIAIPAYLVYVWRRPETELTERGMAK